MYLCVKGIDCGSSYDCVIRYWNYSDSVVFFFHFYFKVVSCGTVFDTTLCDKYVK